MTATATRSASFTNTDARYVGAKIGADLRLLNTLYGRPSLARIDDYIEEAALLLKESYLRTVDYGFRDDTANEWTLRLRYTATVGGHLLDSRPGSLPATVVVAGRDFYSYLTYSAAFHALSAKEQAAIRDRLPVTRTGAAEPTTGSGRFLSGHGYGRNGIGVSRDVYIAS